MPNCRSGYVTKTEELQHQQSTPAAAVSFHSFPIDEDAKRKWLNAIHRQDFVPTKSSRICSLHFYENDFKVNSSDTNVSRKKVSTGTVQLRLLKHSAVPRIFTNQPTYMTVAEPKQRLESACATSRQRKQQNRCALISVILHIYLFTHIRKYLFSVNLTGTTTWNRNYSTKTRCQNFPIY